MPLPPVNVGSIPVNPPPLGPDGPSGPGAPQAPGAPQGPDPSDGVRPGVPVVAPPDPQLDQVEENGGGPDLQPGDGQGRQFVASHAVAPGRDWDLHSAEGMLETVRTSMAHVRAAISGKAAFRSYDEALGAAVAHAATAHPEAAAELADSFSAYKQVLGELIEVRTALMDAVKDGSDCKDPAEALAQIRKTMRVFRYELQKALAAAGHEAGKMGFNEGNLRAIQNAFTFGVGSKVAETFARVVEFEARFDAAVADLRNRLHELDRAALPPVPPPGLKLANAAGDALELSHRTNERIRDFQDAYATESTLRGIVGPLAEKGGSRKVEFTVGVGALFGLGFSEALTAGVRAGARFRIVGEIEAPGKGRPISVTFRIAGGIEAKGVAKAGADPDNSVAGAKGEISGGGEISHFTTRTYPTLEDLILDAKRCKLATSRTLGGAIWGGIKAIGLSIGKLGTTFFRWLGRKSGEVKLDNAQYLESLKTRGVAGKLDRLLAKRANPVVAAERSGWTAKISGKASAGVELGAGVAKLSFGGAAGYERDFHVVSTSFVPLARAAREAKDADALRALMRPGPDGGEPRPVERFRGGGEKGVYASLELSFEDALREAEAAEKNSGPLSTDTAGFARAANRIRSLLLATELAAREGDLPRAEADRLLSRYSNPSVKFPPDVYREYFLEGSGAAKPAKIRESGSVAFEFSLFKDSTDSLTAGIGSSIGKALADGAVKELRHQAGLDTKVEYRFTAERPAKPGADPRPWENAEKTTHALAITASTPARIVVEALTRSIANKGERVENKSPNLAKETAKDLAGDIATDTLKGTLYATLPGLILAGVKETAVAAAKKWLSDPENVAKLVTFALDHLEDAFNLVLDVVEFVAEHPGLTLHAVAMALGTESTSGSERLKVVKWSFLDGELDTISVHSEMTSKIGVNVDPVGVGVGVGFDLSYSVTESVKDRDWQPRPTLVGLLAKSEEFLFGETGIEPSGGGQEFKLWLSRRARGVEHMLGTLSEPKNRGIYERALAQAQGDFELQARLQDAWRAVQNLPADATPDAKVDAAHELLVALTLAFRSAPPDAER
ncbi:MAG: hypothetical protein IJV65_06210 [Kiritimatiellae bacterium]|nr:hypothetical protein [Kiritimatiellia bacterium]